MRAGLVVSIRVNPKDCQSVLDLIDATGINKVGQSFSQLVSLALASMLEAHRMAGNIPEPDPFEYNNRMQYYRGSKNTSKKKAVADIIHKTGSKFKAPVPEKIAQPTLQMPQQPDKVTSDVREARVRLSELIEKQKLAVNDPDVTWSRTDQDEYDQMYKIVYPYG